MDPLDLFFANDDGGDPSESRGAVEVIQASREFQRVDALPRRAPNAMPADFAEHVSALYRRPGGTQTLRPIQAWALYEIATVGGCLAPIGVGCGKTLISLLAALVLRSVRPLLLTKANLLGKTEREMRLLAEHWYIPNHIRLMSYETLSRVSSADVLSNYQPDLIIPDECHKLRHSDAAVTKRIRRCMNERPTTRMVALSGTITSRTVKDYAHISAWVLKAGSPLPRDWPTLLEWAKVIDEEYKGIKPDPGALRAWSENHSGAQDAIQSGFHRRLVETPGVVTTVGERLGTGLEITAIPLLPSRPVADAFGPLRKDWMRPDGELAIDGPSAWRCARELALGFYYRWDPAPPEPWREARRNWARLCREILQNNRKDLDSERQVKDAIIRGEIPGAYTTLAAWEAIEPTFKPNPVPVWICPNALDMAAEWARTHRGIVWTEQRAFGKELAKRACLSYYGAEGVNQSGQPIEMHHGMSNDSLVASTKANAEGRNLQAFHANIETSPHPNAIEWEQKIGRTHRQGQLADTVTFDVFFGCGEHIRAWTDAIARAEYIQRTTGNEQRILYATTNVDMGPMSGVVWENAWHKDTGR